MDHRLVSAYYLRYWKLYFQLGGQPIPKITPEVVPAAHSERHSRDNLNEDDGSLEVS